MELFWFRMKIVKSATAIVLVFLMAVAARPAQKRGPAPESAPKAASVRKWTSDLWSDNDAVRLSAKLHLMAAGDGGVSDLLPLLTDLLDHVHEPHCATGKEIEGRTYWSNRVVYHDLGRYEITSRLIYDCAEILARTKCAEAIPLLIRIMENDSAQMINYAWPYQALVEIGRPAIAPLIETIRDADRIMDRVYDDWGQAQLDELERLEPELMSTAAEPAHTADAENNDKEAVGRHEGAKLQSSALQVIGEIGDRSAIPALKGLLRNPDLSFLRPDVESTILHLSGRRPRLRPPAKHKQQKFSVEGRVVDEAGRPIADAYVYVYYPELYPWNPVWDVIVPEDVTDLAGRFEVEWQSAIIPSQVGVYVVVGSQLPDGIFRALQSAQSRPSAGQLLQGHDLRVTTRLIHMTHPRQMDLGDILARPFID